MTLQDFSRVFAVLALQLRLSDADEATVGAYYESLKDLPLDRIFSAAQWLAREPGRRFFPTTAEWRDAVTTQFQQQARMVLPSSRTEPWHSDCTACDDTGWEEFSCAGTTQAGVTGGCERTIPHAAHSFVRPCPCRETNRTYQRHHPTRAMPLERDDA